jgi:hypothetical protein
MKKTMIVLMGILLLASVLLADDTENSSGEAKYYDNAKVIRIKNIEGEGFVQRSYEEGLEEATPNLPLFEKDTVGTTAGRLGIYLGRLNYLRLDSETTVKLLNIPPLRKTDFIASIEKGAIYLDIENLDNEKCIQIQTPDCGIFLLDKGIYRINVDENSRTEVYVIEGIAEVAGQDDSINVRENQKIVMSQGELSKRPYSFYASEKDDFDSWNEIQNREQGYARNGTSRYLQSGYEDYEYEMSRSGRWAYMSDFNSYVWTPYYSNSDWMPYANGRWVYNPFYGNVWTSYDNCGWFTHHYGRWHWDYARGWYWIPAYHWSPAWVSWFGDSDYYGWCPLSWWDRPVVIINNHWDRNYNYRRGIPHNSRSTIIIRKNELSAPNMQRVALSKNNPGQTGNMLIAYRGTAPAERAPISRVTVINANGKSVAYKKNGIVSSDKYKINAAAAGESNGGASKTATYKYSKSSDAGNEYSPRLNRAKADDKAAATGTDSYFRSKTSAESSSTTTVRSSDSSRSGSKSEAKTGSRENSARSSNSSSSSGGSSGAAKKKKDGTAYQAFLQSENSAGYKSHAAASASSQSGYSAGSSGTDRYAYRSFAAQDGGQASSAAASPSVFASRSSNVMKAVPAERSFPSNGYASHSVSSANRSYGSNSSFRGNDSNNSTVRSSQAIRNDNYSRSTVSASTRSAERNPASTSHANSGSTETARKKNH